MSADGAQLAEALATSTLKQPPPQPPAAAFVAAPKAAAGETADAARQQQQQQQQLAALRRRHAIGWAIVCGTVVVSFIAFTAFVLPGPPPGARLRWPPRAATGVGLRRFAGMLANAAAIAAAMTAFQELVQRPLTRGATSRVVSEKVFFSSSLACVAVFAAALVRHHRRVDGAGGNDDGSATLMLFSIWYGHEVNELAQMALRRRDFTPAFLGLMVPHHLLSMAWLGLWMLVLAPPLPDSVAIWHTAVMYLCGCAPNEVYKLVSLYWRPRWLGWLLGPATMLHWLVLMASKGYYFQQCRRDAEWGCLYPGALVVLAGGLAMVFFDMPFFLNSVVSNNSKRLGVPLTYADVRAAALALLLPGGGGNGRGSAAAAAGGVEGADNVGDAGDDSSGGEGEALAPPPVTVELVFRPRARRGARGSTAADEVKH